MKTVIFNPYKTENIPAFFNSVLNENVTQDYIFFIFNDIADEIKDIQEFTGKYVDLMKRMDLPFSFFPYYIHFNKTMVKTAKIPSPRARITSKDYGKFDVIGSLGYGAFAIDVQKANEIGFRFNEKYKKAFYMQNMVNAFVNAGKWISYIQFVDVMDSFSLMKKNIKTGYEISNNVFQKEKEEFMKENTFQTIDMNEFIKRIKERYGEKKNDAV